MKGIFDKLRHAYLKALAGSTAALMSVSTAWGNTGGTTGGGSSGTSLGDIATNIKGDITQFSDLIKIGGGFIGLILVAWGVNDFREIADESSHSQKTTLGALGKIVSGGGLAALSFMQQGSQGTLGAR